MSNFESTAKIAATAMANTTPEQRSQVAAGLKSSQKFVADQQKRDGGISAVGGAALAAGVVGAVVCGPIVAVGAAGGAAYVCTRDDGYGDAARNVGKTTTGALSSAKACNDEHHVAQRAYDGTKQAVLAAVEFEKKHEVTATIGKASASAYHNALAFNDKHKVSDKVGASVSYGWYSLGKAIGSSKTSSDKAPPSGP